MVPASVSEQQGGYAVPPAIDPIVQLRNAQAMLSAPSMATQGVELFRQAQEAIKSPTYLGVDGKIYVKPGQVVANEQLAFGTRYGEQSAQMPFDAQRIQLQTQADILKKDLEQRGAARFEMVPWRDPVTGQTTQISKEQAYNFLQNQLAMYSQPAGPAGQGTGGGAPGQGGAAMPQFGVPGEPKLTPEQQKRSEGFGDLDAQITQNGVKADTTMQRLMAIENSMPNFTTGAFAQDKLAGGKYILNALQTLGFDDNDLSGLKQYAASGELMDKEAGFMATELARSMGSREAASVVNMVRGFMPNLSMSNGGFRMIVNSLAAGAQRDKDISSYRSQWLADPSHGGTIDGMMDAFNAQRPLEYYASRVIPFPAPMAGGQIDKSQLKPNVLYRNGGGDVALWNGSTMVPVGAQ
jgi:hypothetical protein